jgi:hypothetical protein
VFSTSLGAVFTDLIDSLAKADSERLEEILQDPSHELIAAIASHQKALGQMLVQLDDQGFNTAEQIGWLMIALAEIAACCHEHS